VFPEDATSIVMKRWMRFDVEKSHHAFRILSGEIIQRPARPPHPLAFPMLQRKSPCVSRAIKSEIFARTESVVRHLFLESSRVETVDELAAGYRVRAKLSALRRNLAKQALHFAPYSSFT
jgi:hypothetical protein